MTCPECHNADVEFIECNPVPTARLEEVYSCCACGTQYKYIYKQVGIEVIPDARS